MSDARASKIKESSKANEAELVQLRAQKVALEKLCRSLQAERSKLQAEVGTLRASPVASEREDGASTGAMPSSVEADLDVAVGAISLSSAAGTLEASSEGAKAPEAELASNEPPASS